MSFVKIFFRFLFFIASKTFQSFTMRRDGVAIVQLALRVCFALQFELRSSNDDFVQMAMVHYLCTVLILCPGGRDQNYKADSLCW